MLVKRNYFRENVFICINTNLEKDGIVNLAKSKGIHVDPKEFHEKIMRSGLLIPKSLLYITVEMFQGKPRLAYGNQVYLQTIDLIEESHKFVVEADTVLGQEELFDKLKMVESHLAFYIRQTENLGIILENEPMKSSEVDKLMDEKVSMNEAIIWLRHTINQRTK